MYDDEDPYEDGEYVPVRVFWDDQDQQWKCRCLLHVRTGRCPHVVYWRKIVIVQVKGGYL